MNDSIDYRNNPLHGVSLKNMLIEIVNHYGFDILHAYLNINCFKTNPSIQSGVKFLKKTDWAREKVESFYLYEYKNLPRASADQFELSPRDRIVPEGQTPGEPAKLSLEDAERLQEKRAKKSATRGPSAGCRSGASNNVWTKRNDRHSIKANSDSAQKSDNESPYSSTTPAKRDPDPWAKCKK